tara:strand:- start:208 stop:426 length:219 start_codon:yes stop_codon:yes gene_type:complete
MDNDMDVLAEEIKETESKLIELKKEYRERRTEGLRLALEARKEAELAVREEMKSLGMFQQSSAAFTPYRFRL